MLRLLKWTAGLLLLAVLLAILFREPLFNALFQYRGLRELSSDPSPHPAALNLGDPQGSRNVADCIDAALDSTAAALAFTTGPAPTDAAGALREGQAHCVGYAAVFRHLCQERLRAAGLDAEWSVEQLRGQLFCGELNMHRFFSSPFWKDHDICRVANLRTGERHFVDPTLFDATGIRRVQGAAN